MSIDYRAILANVTLVSYPNGATRAVGNMISEDFKAGQPARNPLHQGEQIRTSEVQSIDVIEGQLVINTSFSTYIVAGSIEAPSANVASKMGLKNVQ